MALTQRHVVITDQEFERLDRFAGKAPAVQLVVAVDEEAHRIQHGVSAVPSYGHDATHSQLIELGVAQASEAVPSVLSEPSETINRQTRVGAGSGGEL